MATSAKGVTSKEGGGDPIRDQGVDPSYATNPSYTGSPNAFAPYTPGNNPINLGQQGPAQGLLGGNWRPPIVSPFTYPQGLLDQIAQSQQPRPTYGQFNRFSFGTPQGQMPRGVQGYAQPVPQGMQGGLLGQIMQMMQKGINHG